MCVRIMDIVAEVSASSKDSASVEAGGTDDTRKH